MREVHFLGQCGFMFLEDGIEILIDPVLTNLHENGRDIMNYPPVMSPEEVTPDYVFCTHDHIDHLEPDTLERIAKHSPETKFVLPRGCAELITARGIDTDRLILMGDGDACTLKEGKLKISAFSTAHPTHHVDANGLDHNLGYAWTIGDRQYVHLGDTYRTPRLYKSLQALGPIDELYVPINGRDDEREARGIIGNLSGWEAAQLAADLEVRKVVPMHFDMVTGNTADPEEFVIAITQMAPNMVYEIPSLWRPENCR